MDFRFLSWTGDQVKQIWLICDPSWQWQSTRSNQTLMNKQVFFGGKPRFLASKSHDFWLCRVVPGCARYSLCVCKWCVCVCIIILGCSKKNLRMIASWSLPKVSAGQVTFRAQWIHNSRRDCSCPKQWPNESPWLTIIYSQPSWLAIISYHFRIGYIDHLGLCLPLSLFHFLVSPLLAIVPGLLSELSGIWEQRLRVSSWRPPGAENDPMDNSTTDDFCMFWFRFSCCMSLAHTTYAGSYIKWPKNHNWKYPYLYFPFFLVTVNHHKPYHVPFSVGKKTI